MRKIDENYAPRFERPENRRKRLRRREMEQMTLCDWVQCIVWALTLGILVFTFLFRPVRVDGHSMLPTLQHNDRLIISNLGYQPKFGDIVVLQTDSFGKEAIVKRIMATEGQTVDIDFDRGIVIIDGVEYKEPYTNTPTNAQIDYQGPVTVPDGCVFVMGDNRNNSTDSRDARIGMVDQRCIIGRALGLVFPGADATTGRIDWSRMFTIYY